MAGQLTKAPSPASTHRLSVGRLSLLLLPPLLLLLGESSPAAAAGPGAIEGRLANGTAGGGSVGSLPVTLLTFRGEQEEARQSTTAGPDGGFRFDALETSAGYTYQVIVPYAQVEYGGEPIVFGPGEMTKETVLSVYETTETDPGLRVEWAMVVLDQADAKSRTVTAFELLTLANPSDRTFLPSTTGPNGPMGLLRFSLPHGAGQVSPGPGLGENALFQVDQGFATTDPVLPGQHELGFRYVFPYQGHSYAFERPVVYQTGELWVLVREDGPTIVSDVLQQQDPISLAGIRYRLQVARDLPAGSRFTLQITDLPGPGLIALSFALLPSYVWGALAVALAMAAVVVYGWRRREQPVTITSDPAAGLLAAVATLDDERAAGRLSEEEHSRRRAALKAALREVYLAQHRLPTRAVSGDEA